MKFKIQINKFTHSYYYNQILIKLFQIKFVLYIINSNKRIFSKEIIFNINTIQPVSY
jgi:hypothetical protein